MQVLLLSPMGGDKLILGVLEIPSVLHRPVFAIQRRRRAQSIATWQDANAACGIGASCRSTIFFVSPAAVTSQLLQMAVASRVLSQCRQRMLPLGLGIYQL